MSDIVKTDPVVVLKKEKIQEGITAWRNPNNGFFIIDLAHTADPAKRSDEWKKTTKSGMPSAEYNREYGDEWIVYDGKPVYQDYEEKFHMVTGTIYAKRRTKLISGWDAGPNDVHLAWVLGMIEPDEASITFIDEHTADDGDAEAFCQVVSSRLNLEWLKLGGFSIHVADQSVFTEDNSVQKRAFVKDMRRFGMFPIPGEISFARRRGVVEKLIKEMPRGNPRWKVHERCEELRAAMRGGYAYEKNTKPSAGGMYKEVPMKNTHSHVGNAMEYACSRIEHATTTVKYEGRPLPRRSMV